MKIYHSIIIKKIVQPHQKINLLIIKNLVLAINVFLILFLIFSCDNKSELVELTVINEMQPCEEENIFYKIISTNKKINQLKSKRDSLVLFLFADSIKTNKNYDLFYPFITQKRYVIKVRGKFLKHKVNKNNSYGCPGSSIFTITQILDVKDVTTTSNFSIKN